MTEPRIAIVHDFLNQQGGAEYVVAIIHEMFPKAPIYTSIYKKNQHGTILTMQISEFLGCKKSRLYTRYLNSCSFYIHLLLFFSILKTMIL